MSKSLAWRGVLSLAGGLLVILVWTVIDGFNPLLLAFGLVVFGTWFPRAWYNERKAGADATDRPARRRRGR